MRSAPKLRWWIAGLLAIATALNYLDRQSFPVAVKALQRDIPLNDQQYSALQSAFLLAYSIMYAGGGRIVDLLGTRMGYMAIVVWWSIANVLHGAASSPANLGIFRFLLGLGEGGSFPASAKAVAEWFSPSERSFAFGMFNTGSSVGAVIAPPLVAIIITLLGGWRSMFVITGLLGIGWTFLWWRIYPAPAGGAVRNEPERGRRTENPAPYRELLRHIPLWGLLIAKFLTDSAWFFFIFWLPKYLGDVRNLNIREIGYYAWIPNAFAGAGSLAGGAISAAFVRRGASLNRARKIPLGMSAALMPVSLLIVSSPLAFAIVFFSVALFAHQFWSTILQTLPADMFRAGSVGSAAGLMGAVGSFGAMLFNLLVGLLLSRFHGYGPVFAISGVLHPLAFVVLIATVPRIRKLDSQKQMIEELHWQTNS